MASPEVLALQRLVVRLKSQRAAAQWLGVGETYLSQILRGKRPMSDRLLSKLGFRRVVVRK